MQLDEHGRCFISESKDLNFRDAFQFIKSGTQPKVEKNNPPNTIINIIVAYIDRNKLKEIAKVSLRANEMRQSVSKIEASID
jgi:hypothetical protein